MKSANKQKVGSSLIVEAQFLHLRFEMKVFWKALHQWLKQSVKQFVHRWVAPPVHYGVAVLASLVVLSVNVGGEDDVESLEETDQRGAATLHVGVSVESL